MQKSISHSIRLCLCSTFSQFSCFWCWWWHRWSKNEKVWHRWHTSCNLNGMFVCRARAVVRVEDFSSHLWVFYDNFFSWKITRIPSYFVPPSQFSALEDFSTLKKYLFPFESWCRALSASQRKRIWGDGGSKGNMEHEWESFSSNYSRNRYKDENDEDVMQELIFHVIDFHAWKREKHKLLQRIEERENLLRGKFRYFWIGKLLSSTMSTSLLELQSRGKSRKVGEIAGRRTQLHRRIVKQSNWTRVMKKALKCWRHRDLLFLRRHILVEWFRAFA